MSAQTLRSIPLCSLCYVCNTGCNFWRSSSAFCCASAPVLLPFALSNPNARFLSPLLNFSRTRNFFCLSLFSRLSLASFSRSGFVGLPFFLILKSSGRLLSMLLYLQLFATARLCSKSLLSFSAAAAAALSRPLCGAAGSVSGLSYNHLRLHAGPLALVGWNVYRPNCRGAMQARAARGESRGKISPRAGAIGRVGRRRRRSTLHKAFARATRASSSGSLLTICGSSTATVPAVPAATQSALARAKVNHRPIHSP